ncbi:MAG: hypothetical protein JW927_12140 [Deltaproteobacteria bacterium]|nr:hypothetical protein [Deltaproteobacteria bacterium]
MSKQSLSQNNSLILHIFRLFVLVFVIISLNGCNKEISELNGSYTMLSKSDSISSTGRIFLFSADYDLGEGFPKEITRSSAPNTQKVKSRVEQKIKTSQIDLPGKGLWIVLWAIALFFYVIFYYGLFTSNDTKMIRVALCFIAVLTLSLVFFKYAPAWCFLWIQWLFFPAIPLAISLINENLSGHKPLFAGLNIVMILFAITCLIYAGNLSGEKIIIDNALEKNVIVKIEGVRGSLIEIPMPSKTNTRVRITGKEWLIETIDDSDSIEKLTVSRKSGFLSSVLYWFRVPGEVCYNVGGANSYSIGRATYF